MAGFNAFSPQHLLWLCLFLISGVVTVRFFPSHGRNVGAVLAVLGRILPGSYEIERGIYGLSSLPLHICALAGYCCFLHRVLTFEKTQDGALVTVLSELLFFPGFPGAVLALLFPGWGYLPIFSFLSICEFLGHFGIVLYVLASIREKALRPAWKRAFIPVCFCILYFAVMMPFDRMTSMNYGFFMQPAPDSPLSWIAAVTGGGVAYFTLYALTVLAVMGFCYMLLPSAFSP